MKSVRASVLATLFFTLAAATPWIAPLSAQAQPAFRTPQIACSQAIGAAGRRYIEQVLAARIRCENRAIKGIIPPATNCLTGDGDDKFQAALRKAQIKLSHSLPTHCTGVDLTELEFPGVCTDQTGNPFDTLDLEDCIVAKTDSILSELLGVYYPPIADFFRGFKSVCLRGVPLHAFKMFRGDIRSRAACTIDKAFMRLGSDVDCRNEIPSWGPGTGDEIVDLRIRRAYVQFLGAIPVECSNFDISDLGYQNVCPDGTGGVFTVFDLKECIFEESRPQTQHVMNLLFPTDPVCGNGRVEPTEQCDDGQNNSDTAADACRTNCTDARCGDGAVDTGETCDDGNSIETDDCTSACVPGSCGDGVQQGSEECDDGATLNSDTTPDACRENCENPSCGDSVTDPSFGDEECDDGDQTSNDGCSSTCKIEFCGDGIKQTNEECDGSAAVCGQAGAVCSGGCECQLPCPGTGELTLFSGYGEECTTNADCPVGTCNPDGSGRCRTVTELDSGWTGNAHDADINNGVVTRGFLECDATSAPCGVCEVAGIDPIGNSCRCANNNQTICDQPFQADADDCGGQICDCYFGAPFPLSSAGTPACIVNRFFEDVTGTANVDLGAGAITANLRTQVFLGISTTQPCPVCAGKCQDSPSTICLFDEDCNTGACNFDPVRDDGIRGGTCYDGRNHGTPCDVNGTNSSFPARPNEAANGGYSIDCFPDNGKNVSGAGLIIQLTQTTGQTELASNVECGVGDLLCPCRMCSGDTSVPCNSHDDCSAQAGSCTVSNRISCMNNADCQDVNVGICKPVGMFFRCENATTVNCTTNADCASRDLGACNVSTCSSNASGSVPIPNECTDQLCTDIGNGEGECTIGPDSATCDAVVRANGDGILTCTTNGDCGADVVGIPAGNCENIKRKECFLDPIVAVGQANPTMPIGAAAFCVGPTSNTGINNVAGLPGPGRVVNQARSRTFCESDPTRQYQPGIGGCID